MEKNFREKFEALNRVHLTDSEFSRLMEEIITPDVFTAATHAIEDQNVLKFHIDYYKPEGKNPPKPGEAIAKRAVVEAILAKHNTSTSERRFNAILATASINDAIEYHGLFQTIQAEKQATDPDFVPLNVACVFSPPAEGDADVKQIQEDLPQEKEENAVEPEKKKAALKSILADYNARYGSNHTLSEFDPYYQDVQKRIKDHQWSNADLRKADPKIPHHKIDITIVVDMLLTGFDSKYLNTLYVDKNLKHHGLIQAFSRTNRVLNGTKPYGNILDFRQQQDAVDAAIALFSGEKAATIEQILPKETQLGFRGAYLETAQRLKAGRADVPVGSSDPIDQLDFEFVLFASAVIDYDYIMGLIAKFSAQGPEKSKMSREQLVGLIVSDAKFMDEREDISAYIATLKAGEGLSETTIREGYTRFKAEKQATELADLASRHGLATAALQTFVDGILQRMIFDGEHLGDLMAPLGHGWKARTQAELTLMDELAPLLRKRAQGRDISGLNAYEQ